MIKNFDPHILQHPIDMALQSHMRWARGMNGKRVFEESVDPSADFPVRQWRNLARFVDQVASSEVKGFMEAFQAAKQQRLVNSGLDAIPHKELDPRGTLAEFYIDLSELKVTSGEAFKKFLALHRHFAAQDPKFETSYFRLCGQARDLFYTPESVYLANVETALAYLDDMHLEVDEAVFGAKARFLKFHLSNAREIESYGAYIIGDVPVYEKTDTKIVVVIADHPQDWTTTGALSSFIQDKKSQGFNIKISLRDNTNVGVIDTPLGTMAVIG